MPKNVYKITNFNDGLVTQLAASDIKDNQLTQAEGVTSTKTGSLTLQGDGKTSAGFYKDTIYNSQGGYGLHHFVSEYDMLDSSTGDLLTDTVTPMPAGTEAEYIMLRDGKYVDIYQKHDLVWHSGTGFNIAGATNYTVGSREDIFPVYFDVNGSVRFTDGGFNTGPNASSTGVTGRKKLELVNDDYLTGCTIYDAGSTSYISGPYPKENRGWKSGNDWLLDSPDQSKIISNIGSTSGTGPGGAYDFEEGEGWSSEVDSIRNAIEDGGIGYLIRYSNYGFGGAHELGRPWPSGNYRFGFSYYDRDGQDTEVVEDITAGDTTYINIVAPLNPLYTAIGSLGSNVGISIFHKPYSTSDTSSSDGYHFDERIKGIRVWVKNNIVVEPRWAGNYPPNADDAPFREVMGDMGDDWRLCTEYDFVKGSKQWQDSTWEALHDLGRADVTYNNLISNSYTGAADTGDPSCWYPANSLTYQEINGHAPEKRFKCRMRSVTVTGNRAYAGNVAFIDDDGQIYDDGVKSDVVIQSPLSQYDVFPEDNHITVIKNDGDSILHLESYSERLLIFKRNIIYIVNVISTPFVENEYKFISVRLACQVLKLQDGIFWITEEGLYFYNGQKGSALNMSRNIKDYWSTFFDVTKNPSISYDRENNQLIILNGNETGAGQNDIIIYDLTHKAFFTGDAKFNLGSCTRTNLITMLDGTLMYRDTTGSNDYFYNWDNTAINDDVIIQTKDINFNIPSNRKAIHNVYVTSRGCDGLTLYGAADGSGISTSATTGWTEIGELSSTTESKVDTFKISTPIFKTLNTFQIRIQGNPSATYQSVLKVDDISITFRTKANA